MWDFFETVRNRHSVRRYQEDMPVEEQKLHAILEAACAAPSAGDLQSYRIVVVQDAATRSRLMSAAGGQTFIGEAPICLVFCADRERSEIEYGHRGAQLFAVQDATIAASYAQLASVAAGMASAWVGRFDETLVQSALDLESYLQPVAILTVGYPAELPGPSKRRRLDEIVRYR